MRLLLTVQPAVRAAVAADLLGRPARERPFDHRRLLHEARGRAVGVGADPPALAPHQAHRPPSGREVPDLDDAAPVPGRLHATARTAGHVGRRLDEDPHLPVLFGLGKDDEPVLPQQRGRTATTVTHALCPPFSQVW